MFYGPYCFFSSAFLLLFGKRLCFEKCYINRGSKYKVCVGVCIFSRSQCVSLNVRCVFGCTCFCCVCGHLPGYKTFLCSMKCPERLLSLPKTQPWPLTTAPAAHNPATSCILSIPAPSIRSYGDSRTDTHFPQTSAPKPWRLEEKGFKTFSPKEVEEM